MYILRNIESLYLRFEEKESIKKETKRIEQRDKRQILITSRQRKYIYI